MTETQALTGITVAVTRPAKQAGPLCQLIEAQGGKAISFPSLEILAAQASQQTASLVGRLDRFDIAIFIRVNAVEAAANLMGEALPAGLTLAAVGNSSRMAVEQQWPNAVI